jgi:hypothetical protein
VREPQPMDSIEFWESKKIKLKRNSILGKVKIRIN